VPGRPALLLARDAPLFLERYGAALSAEELVAFDALSPDTRSTGTSAACAYLDRLVREGDYFSEDAMREPYLHHEYLSRFHGAPRGELAQDAHAPCRGRHHRGEGSWEFVNLGVGHHTSETCRQGGSGLRI